MDLPKEDPKGFFSRGSADVGRRLWQLAAFVLAIEAAVGGVLSIVALSVGLDGFTPYGFRTSVLDAALLLTLAGAAGLGLGLPRGVFGQGEAPRGADAATWRTSLLHGLLLLLVVIKAAAFGWGDEARTGPELAAAGATLGAALGLGLATVVLVRLARDACVEERRQSAVLYSRLLGEEGAEGGAGDEEEPEIQELGAWAIIRTLKPYFWPRSIVGRCFVGLTWVCVGGSKATGVVAPFFISFAADDVDKGEIRSAIQNIGIFGTLLFISKALKEAQTLAYLRVAQAAFVDLAEDTFKHVHSLSLSWHLKKKLGEVVRVSDRGTAACDTLMRYGVLYMGPAVLETLSVCVLFLVYYRYWPLALTVFVCVAIYAALTIKLTLWRKRFRKSMNQADNEWHDKLTDSLVNYETVKYFTNEEYEAERFLQAVSKYQTSNLEVLASLSVLNTSQQLILQACLIGALSLSAVAIHHGDMTLGDFVGVNTWVINLFTPLNFLGGVYNAIVTAWVDLKNLSELFAQEPDVVDRPDARPFPRPTQSITSPGLGLSFDDVAFTYKENGRGLKGVSFQVAAGTTTAIVGHTGAGKTTVSRLLFRFYDPTRGGILLDGVDLRKLTQISLRETIGVVPQDTVLFNDTIRHNIAYGKLDATQQEIEDAAAGAQILDFILSLPDGFDTTVGERGLKLSGGEKQRVAIARCLLKDPPVVLLDEATSALDSKTEKSVQLALNALGKNRTCLVIAHRLGTISDADQIIVLDQGRIKEQGSHDELLRAEGDYYDMWEAQRLKPVEETKEGAAEEGFEADAVPPSPAD